MLHTIKSYYKIIDYIPCAVHYIPVITYFIIGGLYLLIPFTISPSALH